MKKLIYKVVLPGLAMMVFSLGLGLCQIAIASQLENISWEKETNGEDVLNLQLDDHPDYTFSESGDGYIIEMTLKKTSLSDHINQIEPKGLVKSFATLTEGDNVKIQFLLSQTGRAKAVPVDDGFKVLIIPVAGSASDSEGKMTGLRFSRINGNRVQIDFAMDGVLKNPRIFKTVSPRRIVLDFFDSKNASGKKVFAVGISSVDSIVVSEDENKMRIVLNLLKAVDYKLTQTNAGFSLTIGASAATVSTTTAAVEENLTQSLITRQKPRSHSLKNVDFRRLPNGGGRIVIEFSDTTVAVDLQDRDSEIVALFSDTSIPSELEQRLDVVDFATPVSYIDTYADGRHTKMVITTTDQFKQSSVQSGRALIVDISPLSETEIEAENIDEFSYKGEHLSLNFQKISVRAALQVIADFTELNFVTSDAITGNLSLKLKDVPWDQALDVILLTKGLAMRQKGNVVWVAPASEIIEKERQSLEAEQEKGALEPLISELIRISYAKVEDIASLLKSVKAVETGMSQSTFGSVTVNEVKTEENSLLSSRGSVTVDSRTNSLLIQDTATKLKEIKAVIGKLDIPVRQVQIETRIVQANDDFSKNIGVRLGFTRATSQARVSNTGLGEVFGSGTLGQTNNIRTNGNTHFTDDALSVNLPADSIGGGLPGSYAFTIAKLGSGFLNLLDLELSALQAEGKGKILANPKILTTDKRSARIEQGQERLTTFGSAFGTTATQGQRAVLSFTVLPQITPDDKVILDVDITNDAFAVATYDTVNTQRINTQALLENGETVVIGGIYTQNETFNVTKVPLLGDMPLIGTLFRKKTSRNNRTELLVFLTPRIIDPALAVQ